MEDLREKTKKIGNNSLNNFTNKKILYVIHSTLNQAVNYTPLLTFKKEFQIKSLEILNITLCDNYKNGKPKVDVRFKNCKWDEYLKKHIDNNKDKIVLYNTFQNLSVGREDYNNLAKLKYKIKEAIENKRIDVIFWNITGGQRPYIMAVNSLVNEIEFEQYILYIEGNKGKMIIWNKEGETFQKDYKLSSHLYSISDALKLMGFDIRYIKKEKEREKDKEFENLILEIYDKFIKNKNFRLDLLKTKKKDCHESFLDVLIRYFSNKEETIKKYFSEDQDQGKNKYKKYHGDNKNKIGYLLEDMVYYKIINDKKIFKEIVEIYYSLKINFDKATFDDNINLAYPIDEFDIILMNKYGHIIVFECKSGTMLGDVAKSTKYSTYAISGVYGLPILITPLLEKEINDAKKLEKYKDYKLDGTIRAAKRANLEVWGIDEFIEKLKDYLS